MIIPYEKIFKASYNEMVAKQIKTFFIILPVIHKSSKMFLLKFWGRRDVPDSNPGRAC